MTVKFEVPEIPPQFVIPYMGKSYITSPGLIYLGHLQGLKRVDCQVLVAPTASSIFTVVRCEVETNLGVFSDYGSVSDGNKGSVGGKYPVEMATTRARNRALRIATACPLASYEEMGSDSEPEHEQEQQPPKQSTPPRQITAARTASMPPTEAIRYPQDAPAAAKQPTAPKDESALPATPHMYAILTDLTAQLRALGEHVNDPQADLSIADARRIKAFYEDAIDAAKAAAGPTGAPI